MKLILIIKTLLLVLLISFCFNLKMNKKNHSPFIQIQSPDFTARIDALFSDPKRLNNPCDCEKPEDYIALDTLIDNDPENDLKFNNNPMWSLPKKKKNKYEMKHIGWDASAYLFDYLDPILQKPIKEEFARIYKEAFKIADEPGYQDPYTIQRMANPSGTLGDNLDDEELVKKIVKFIPNFDYKDWKTFISASKLSAIVKAWGWDYNVMSEDFAKEMIDKFDFDGDGRLRPYEFFILLIVNNKKSMNSLKPCINCLEEIIKKIIYPIFFYIDCDGDNLISSENIWSSLKSLNRKEAANTYNMYNCVIDGSQVRTVSVNDFVLKSQKSMMGKLNKEEFSYGILLGYWHRQSGPKELNIDFKNINAKNMKSLRWSEDGSIDKSCENMKKLNEL